MRPDIAYSPGATPLDDATKQSILEGVNFGMRDEADFIADELAGTGDAVGLLDKGNYNPYKMEGSTDAMDLAMQRRIDRDHQNKMRELERIALLSGFKRKADSLAQAGQNVGTAESIRLRNIQMKEQYDMQKRQLDMMEAQARGNILSQILGGVFSFAGAGLAGILPIPGGKKLSPANVMPNRTNQMPSISGGDVVPMGGDPMTGSAQA